MQIAILMSNTDESDFSRAHPKDGEKWTSLLAPLRPDWRFEVFCVKDGAFPAEITRYDGLIVTGSPASVHDGEPWIAKLLENIRTAHARDVPLFGACFGHQAVTVALGGKVETNPGGWVLGLEETQVTRPLPWIGDTGPLRQHAAHVEQVTKLPEGAQVYSGNARCPVGGFVIGKTVFTTQYHPEISRVFILALIDELEPEKPPEVIAAARASLTEAAENQRVADWIVNFFEAASQPG